MWFQTHLHNVKGAASYSENRLLGLTPKLSDNLGMRPTNQLSLFVWKGQGQKNVPGIFT